MTDTYKDLNELSVYHGKKKLLDRFEQLKQLRFQVKDGYAYFWHSPPAFDYSVESDDEQAESEAEFLKLIKECDFSKFDFWRWQASQEYGLNEDGGSLFSIYFVRITVDELFNTACDDDTEVSFCAEPLIIIAIKWLNRDNEGDHFNLISLQENLVLSTLSLV